MLAPDPSQVVHIRRLEIENVRCFERLVMECESPATSDSGQWTILLGDNGVGKSTLLRTIALATADERVAWSLLEKLGGDWVRRGADGESRVTLETSEATWNQTYRQSPSVGGVEVHGHSGATPMVLAYGVGRGTALGGPDRAVRLEAQTEGRQTLFYAGALVHAETWLRNLALAATESAADKAFFDAVCRTLCDLLPGVDHLAVQSDGVWAEGEAVGRVSLVSLSDGYLTTLGWTLDLVARWSHLVRGAGEKLKGGLGESITGLVLIDELDLHLHPRWQIEIVSSLRTAFPRLSFIATTHNPLTLRGAEPGEIHVLSREDETSHQIDPRPGLRTDELLTGAWFGLGTTLDDDTLELLRKYQKSAVSDPGGEATRALEDELRSRLGSFADTEEERRELHDVARRSQDAPLEQADIEALRSKMNDLYRKGS